MTEKLKLMGVFAHPDDETLGAGGIFIKAAAEGVETYVLTATRGERGWFEAEADNPGLTALGKLREAELREAAKVLGVHEVSLLDYVDGELDQADYPEAVSKIVSHLRRVRPQVVVTFDPFGAYGHPDHIAINQMTTTACVCAADATYGSGEPHLVSKLYYLADRKELLKDFEDAGGELVMVIDGVERRPVGWEGWAITTRVEVGAYSKELQKAARKHKTQLPSIQAVLDQPEDVQQRIWNPQTLYRAFSMVNGGRQIETDLFEGIR